jgi:choice-of-anchor A domain-containing protein
VTSGEVGVAFNSGAMTVTGGTSPYTFSVVGTLPAGLTLNASTGAVTGTPTAAGSFTIKVVDANGVSATGTCGITIIAGPTLSCSSVTSGEVGVAFNSGAMTVTGGTSPYTFSVVGTLPAGLTLNTTTGAVTGTPTAAGSFTIKVVDANGVSATGTCAITIIAGPTLSCSSVTSGEVGVAFNSGAMTVTGGTSPYTFSVVGTLPAGLTLNTTTGAVTGTPTTAGSFTIKVVDANGVSATGTCAITIIAGPTLSCSSVTSGEVGVAFNSGAMTVTGGTSPYTFSVVGTLPAGLTLNTTTGAVTGTPTTAGSFTIKVVDANGVSATGTCAITIIAGPTLSCSSVTSGEVGVAFNSGAMTVTGGTSPYTFSVVGTLPAGLTLNASTGAVMGTPTAAGSFTIKVVDSKGVSATGTCGITIIAGPTLSCSSVTSGEVGVAFNSGAMTVTGGTSPYTFSVVGTLPAGLTLNTTTGAVTGTPTAAGSFTLKVVDANGVSATGTCAITIIAGPTLSCSSVTSGEVGVTFNSGAMTVTGGTSPYTFSVVGTLPAGLTLNASTGAVTGTPTAAGSFTIKVVDANGVSATGTCAITIIAGPTLSCSSVTSGEVGVAFNSGAMTVTGGTSPYTFSVVGTLPAGLTLNATTGAVTGTPTAAGSFTLKVVDAKGVSATGTCAITIAPGVNATCVSIDAVQGNAIVPVTLTASGGSGTGYSFTATGLPAGLSISSTGTISGTPTVSGTFNYTVTITDSKGNKGTLSCSITVAPPVTTGCVTLNAELGVAITPVQLTASGGSGGSYSFSATGLPPGLTLSSSGLLSGTPTASGTFTYTVTVTDNGGIQGSGRCSHKGTYTCTITVASGPSLSCSSVTSGQVGVAFNSGAMTVTGGTAPYIFSVVGTLPAGLTLNTATGAVTGTPTASGSFSIEVTDAKGAISTTTCTITIAGTTGPSCVFGVASAYNLVALTGNISDSADITGRIAADGQVTQATTIGSGLRTSDTYLTLASANGGPWAIVAAGGIPTSNSFNVNAGGNVYSSTATGASFNFANENYSGSAYTGSKLVTGGSSPINFSTLQTEMYALTKQLAGLTANGVVCSVNSSGKIVSGGGCPSSSTSYNPSWLVLYGTSTTTNIFNLTQAQFQGSNNLDIVVPAGSTVIINVAGTSDTLQSSIYYNGTTVADTNASSILFNFASATTVTINGQFDAALLAPYAKLSGGSQMGGMFIAASIGSTGEVHYDAFKGSIPYSGTCSQ